MEVAVSLDDAMMSPCDTCADCGDGHAAYVVLVHGSLIAGAFAPLRAEPALTERHRLVMYHRRGFAGSTHPDGPLPIAQQAADCRAFMRHLGVQCAHIVGHPYAARLRYSSLWTSPIPS
jgi:pimeloyl-ACP methyl ester carboxylesterase